MKIEIEDISFSYTKNKNTLYNMTFDVSEGDICCILGKNASGKTTLVKCICKLLEPSKGKIYYNGNDISKMDRKTISRKLAFIPQEHRLSFNYNVIDVVLMGRYPHRKLFNKVNKKDLDIVFKNLCMLNIEHLSYKNYNELSGGEKQLVLIARALTQEPEVFILDEPTSHLDFKNQHLIMNKINKIACINKISIILTMHDPNLALKYCNKFISIKTGRIISVDYGINSLDESKLKDIYDMEIRIKQLNDAQKIILPNI